MRQLGSEISLCKPARRETLAQRRMTPIFVPLWFGWALTTGHKGGHFALLPGDCLQQPDSVAERVEFELTGDLRSGLLAINNRRADDHCPRIPLRVG